MAKPPAKSPAAPTGEVIAPGGPVLPYGKRPLRTFALAIGLPAFLLYVASAALVIGALAMMAKEIDRLEDARGITAMHAALDSFLNGLGDSVADEGTWNEAYLKVVVNSDPAWMDTTWGAAARLGSLYDTVIVTDPAGIIVFGEDAKGAIKGDISARYPATRTMLRELDKGIAATGDATTISNFTADGDGMTGLAAISIHQSTIGEMRVPRQLRRILWIGRRVTPALLQDFSSRYQTPLATLSPDVDRDSSSIAFTDADGKPAGTISWVPDRPGEAAFSHAVLIATAIFFVIGLLLVLGLGVIRRAMLRRAAAMHQALAAAVAAAPAPSVKPEETVVERRGEPVEGNSLAAIEGVIPSDFSVQYQPVLDLREQSLVGVEALLRWPRPDKATVNQEDLGTHEAAALTERVAISAIRHASGEIAPLLGLLLTVSVTAAQLATSVFAEKIVGTLGAMNLPLRRLQLSVDAMLLPEVARLRDPIAELRGLGVQLALSNFTLGPANMDYVRAGLADRIRLSPLVSTGIDADPIRQQLVEITVGAARAAGLAITAPGIVRRADAARLLRLGCREFQGDMLAPPMSLPALTNLVLSPPQPAQVKRAS